MGVFVYFSPGDLIVHSVVCLSDRLCFASSDFYVCLVFFLTFVLATGVNLVLF